MSEHVPAVAAFLDGLVSGEWQPMEPHYRDDVIFQGTVPRWYFAIEGRQNVIEQMGGWFPFSGELSDLQVMENGEGAVVEFERRWLRPSDSSAAGNETVGVRQAHIFLFDEEGRIREQHGHCAGIWDNATFEEIEQAHATV
ncbi:MAG: nuclear transport factor 2 family protein [Thermomicrobiales bacterium]